MGRLFAVLTFAWACQLSHAQVPSAVDQFVDVAQKANILVLGGVNDGSDSKLMDSSDEKGSTLHLLRLMCADRTHSREKDVTGFMCSGFSKDLDASFFILDSAQAQAFFSSLIRMGAKPFHPLGEEDVLDVGAAEISCNQSTRHLSSCQFIP